jgi:hypothetical protein
MKRLISTRTIAAAAVVLGGFAAASAAHARSDVIFSIGVQSPGYVQHAPVYVQPHSGYVQPRPVYVQPQPVYVQPQPFYVQPRHVYVPPPVYTTPAPVYGQGWQNRNRHDRHDGYGRAGYNNKGHHYGQGRHARVYGPYGDLDRDGIPNINDRDRDGDGVRNRHDRAPGNPYYR